MKFVKRDGDHLVFQMGKREKSLLFQLLRMYPVVPPAHHQISTMEDWPKRESTQHLLDEALAEHRAENRRQLMAMIEDPKRFEEASTGYRLRLTPGEVEWLLQVLNDIRVGSWLLLGEPDERHGKRLRISLKNARHLWAMELAGHFQFVLMSAEER